MLFTQKKNQKNKKSIRQSYNNTKNILQEEKCRDFKIQKNFKQKGRKKKKKKKGKNKKKK